MSLELMEEVLQADAGSSDRAHPQKFHKCSAAVLVMASSACFAVSLVTAKYTLEKVAVPTVLLIESLSSVIFLWSLLGIRKIPIGNFKSLFKASFTGILEPGLSYSIGTIGLALTTASNASLISSTEPLVTTLLAAWLLREKLTGPILATIAATTTGVILVCTPNFNHFGVSSLLGDSALMLAIFCAALYAIASRRWVSRINPLLLVTAQQSIALLFFIIITLLMSQGHLNFAGLTPTVFLLNCLSGILGYAMASWLQLEALSQQTASMTALYLTLTPIFSLIPAYCLLHERLSLQQFIGSLITIGAIVLLTNLTEDN
jgi:drug/metabolite transporter (DMT)-like permease